MEDFDLECRIFSGRADQLGSILPPADSSTDSVSSNSIVVGLGQQLCLKTAGRPKLVREME
jgi:hypothetical protein